MTSFQQLKNLQSLKSPDVPNDTRKTSGTHFVESPKEFKKKSLWKHCLRYRTRPRGTAIVETSQGIILVSENGKKYDLPGGAAKNGESRKVAALRELEEETGLKAVNCSWLFEFRGRIQRSIKGGFFRDYHKVYLMEVDGVAEPKNEINFVAYYNKDSKVNLSYAASKIIQKYSKCRGLNGDSN